MPDYDAVLCVTAVCHDIGSRPILRDVSFTVGPGTRLGVTGPNGVGKSTLLKIVAGLIAPTSGSVAVSPPQATVGYLAQERVGPAGRSGATAAD
ncbi:MAG TPA: ATP-binding cassette domain-containing protein, partial [Acidimicrobiales bacterium]|nr:ATP-binding cassette domain-containing protein [Acidimicrobiales bacterium]